MDARIPSRQPTQSIDATAARVRELTQPHVASFNYLLTEGLPTAVEDIPYREVRLVKPPTTSTRAPTASTPQPPTDTRAGDAAPPKGKVMRFWLEDAQIGYPQRKGTATDSRMFPAQARELGQTYAAPLLVTLCRTIDDGEVEKYQTRIGDLPIMVGSLRCHLSGLSSADLVARHEEPVEAGGYFICNGIERVIRMLQVPRRNYPMAITRSAYAKRGPLYSNKAVTVRSVRKDQSGLTITLHYLNDGSARVRFTMKKQEFFVPVVLVLKALVEITDREMYDSVLGGDTSNAALSDAVALLQRDFRSLGLKNRAACLEYLGSRFRAILDMPETLSDFEAGVTLLDRFILIHLESDCAAKFDLLVIMLRKLYGFVAGDVVEDNADSLMNQELLLPGHLYLMFLKEKLHEFLVGISAMYTRDLRTGKIPADPTDLTYFRRAADRQADVGKKAYYLLATGNLVSTSGLDLMQTSGFTVVADKINYMRFLTHFRSVHRGQFFTTMKTTSVRKLLPESWGFMCPVHTPDGSPCGLLNHLALNASAVTHPCKAVSHLPILLASLGMTPSVPGRSVIPFQHLPVLLDGRVIGSALPEVAARIATSLRALKVAVAESSDAKSHADITRYICAVSTASGSPEAALFSPPADWVPESMEVCLIPQPTPSSSSSESKSADDSDADMDKEGGGSHRLSGPFPGLFLATEPARLIRPVRQVNTGLLEILGAMEQVYMEIACTPDDVIDIIGVPESELTPSTKHPYTHAEVSSMSMLSLAASLTPFSDLNQSPRNMYQCQMGKQTMGTPVHAYTHRTDTKLYRIQTPQAPAVQAEAQREYCMDEYPSGTNAIVAVISYTGYDMEDAMIINRGAYERGFAHASVYKTKVVDLNPDNRRGGSAPPTYFSNIAPASLSSTGAGGAAARGRVTVAAPGAVVRREPIVPSLDEDGLPPVGLKVAFGDPLYCVVDRITGHSKIGRHKEGEPAVVDEVRLLGNASGGRLTKISIKLRFNRNPVVGDKFSSRHGQKGVLSTLLPQEDMPFTESGMTPDVIINPHAFPSRMTIGMLIESMAGKVCAMQGRFEDCTPFKFNERQKVVDYMGEQLAKSGYSYYGSEPLYSGTNGTELKADIFIGMVYYQRLRHMVSDKSQVRSTGPINPLTRQPVKGRKNHGGIRFGEMERDSLIAHGTAFLLRDRLLNCSDRHTGFVCRKCGSLLSTVSAAEGGKTTGAMSEHAFHRPYCRSCDSGAHVTSVILPYVFRYLANELAGMNIRLTLEVQ